jgi:hypothetical protein
MQTPFANWYIFERLPEFGSEHGSQRISLLYMGTEAVATYLSLYLRNKIVPKVFAVVQPGSDGGPGHTDLRDSGALLARAMSQQELPLFMVSGGIGQDYLQSFWPTEYPYEISRFQDPTGTGLWSRYPIM